MSNKFSTFICQNCGSETSQYFGRCLNCNEWNTIVEERKNTRSKITSVNKNKKSKLFNEIEIGNISRFTSGFKEFDRVLGGGIVPGSIVLLGGEPGIGKSTIVLQSAGKISLNEKVLYITAEESLEQVKIRWERLNQSSLDLKIYAETNLSLIIEEIKKIKPGFAIIDSIQAINNDEMESSPGSVSQVRTCSSELQNLAKENNIALLIIGHVTKDGALAGPKTLEHLVDVVLNFEGDNIASHRLLRSVKNRFGSTFEIGIFEMLENGLREVINPSSIFTNKENIAGVTTTITNEGSRPFAVDIQALVNKTFYNNPRRTTTGMSINRLHQILAVIEKHVGIKLSEYDCYIATGGGFEINDPSSDLGVAISILSSLKNIPPLINCAFIGELGLSGQVRQASNIRAKIDEAIRLGIKNILLPKITSEIKDSFQKFIQIKEISNINEAINYALNE
ncbi:putative DNA repair protein RadA [Prochlorococcus marinus subsp. pastoris str. CCMP1986]|uniref:DNA repair protein RadA n=1 Tax=Prochlorococcus marinus subsp. pastoris (strain CCMP1986 / NIES-2087 / MED4) TaxID=59919 RepID=Q7V3E3_PROMP|nr:DNA repair protein RadA [Prochlorococcus marinus]KGF88115.1 DNA repair protein RadA [Prochlorococcus marinus str. EQPAC1]CAE18592.1 putative DNA repair protein RadA [Prochlorococcus marinus subsp. pastoris str. CCMP1986]